MDWKPALEAFRDFLTLVLPVLSGYLVVQLKRNTDLTNEVKSHTGGELADLRNRVQALSALVDLYRDLVRYLKSTPEGRNLVLAYQDRRRTIIHDEDLTELERRVTDDHHRL